MISAMFRAIGFGFSRSLPSAAALNLEMKDELGRLSRCIYTAYLASAFDTNLKDRLELITKIWIELGYVPSPAQVSKVEGVGFFRDSDEVFYQAWRYCPSESVVLCIREGAVTSDIIMGLLQACYIRKGLNVVDWENVFEACDSSDSVIEWFILMGGASKIYIALLLTEFG